MKRSTARVLLIAVALTALAAFALAYVGTSALADLWSELAEQRNARNAQPNSDNGWWWAIVFVIVFMFSMSDRSCKCGDSAGRKIEDLRWELKSTNTILGTIRDELIRAREDRTKGNRR